MTYTDLGSLLRHAREAKCLSLDGLAKIVGCTKPHMWELETGRTCNPRAELAIRLSDALQIPVENICRLARKNP